MTDLTLSLAENLNTHLMWAAGMVPHLHQTVFLYYPYIYKSVFGRFLLLQLSKVRQAELDRLAAVESANRPATKYDTARTAQFRCRSTSHVPCYNIRCCGRHLLVDPNSCICIHLQAQAAA